MFIMNLANSLVLKTTQITRIEVMNCKKFKLFSSFRSETKRTIYQLSNNVFLSSFYRL